MTATIKPAWTVLNVGLMLLGFLLYWPLGLAMLGWMIFGERIQDWWARNREAPFAGLVGDNVRQWQPSWQGSSGNAAFDTYRRETLDRLEAERRRLEDEQRAFGEFLKNLHRARDQEEFNRFMEERRTQTGSV
jgi:Protein of unknown function (DUF2852)